MSETEILVTHAFKGDGEICERTHLTRGSMREHCQVPREAHPARPTPPAWMAKVIERWGAPRVEPPIVGGQWQEIRLGSYLRRAWVWFPDAVNHGCDVDRYAGYTKYRIWGGDRQKGPNGFREVSYQITGEPDLDVLDQLVPLVWP